LWAPFYHYWTLLIRHTLYYALNMINVRYISHWSSTPITTFSDINNTALRFHNSTPSKVITFRAQNAYLNLTKHLHVSLSNFNQLPLIQINSNMTTASNLLSATRLIITCWIRTLELNFTTTHTLFKMLAEKFIRQSTAVSVTKKLRNVTLLNMNSKYI